MARVVDGGGFFVEIAEEIVERLVDLHVHVDGDVGFDGLQFNVDTATKKEGTSKDQEEAAHN